MNIGLLDLIMHQLPLYILLINRGGGGIELGLYLLPLYYYLIFEIKRYNIRERELVWLILIWLSLPFLLKNI